MYAHFALYCFAVRPRRFCHDLLVDKWRVITNRYRLCKSRVHRLSVEVAASVPGKIGAVVTDRIRARVGTFQPTVNVNKPLGSIAKNLHERKPPKVQPPKRRGWNLEKLKLKSSYLRIQKPAIDPERFAILTMDAIHGVAAGGTPTITGDVNFLEDNVTIPFHFLYLRGGPVQRLGFPGPARVGTGGSITVRSEDVNCCG